MIRVNDGKIVSMHINGWKVLSVYMQEQKIWPEDSEITEILSCYYNGYWIDEYPWTDDTPWTD